MQGRHAVAADLHNTLTQPNCHQPYGHNCWIGIWTTDLDHFSNSQNLKMQEAWIWQALVQSWTIMTINQHNSKPNISVVKLCPSRTAMFHLGCFWDGYRCILCFIKFSKSSWHEETRAQVFDPWSKRPVYTKCLLCKAASKHWANSDPPIEF